MNERMNENSCGFLIKSEIGNLSVNIALVFVFSFTFLKTSKMLPFVWTNAVALNWFPCNFFFLLSNLVSTPNAE